MNVTFCDACGIECEHGSLPFTPLIHIVEIMAEGKVGGYVDPDRQPISGRQEHYDLCHECYNSVFSAAMKEFLARRPRASDSTEPPSEAAAV